MLNRLRSALGRGLVIALIAWLTACGDDEGGPADPDVGTPAQLAFTTEASDVAAGGAITPAPQVAIRDASSNLVTSATNAVTVELASNPGGATLTGTTTVNAVNGVATFNDLSVEVVGSGLRLRATSGSLTPATSAPFDILFPVASFGPGGNHTCALTTGGNAYCWGTNFSGQLGDGTTTDRLTPVLAVGGLSFTWLTAGSNHTCGLTTGGDAYCWGFNRDGQLGDGSSNDRSTPGLVSGGLSFTSLGAGNNYTCGVAGSGDAYCWGSNAFAQLGDSTRTGRLTPVLVSGGLSFASLTASNHTCGLTTGGDAYCWGFNFFGQLGDGTATDRLTPVLVAGGLSFASLSAGGNHTCGQTAGDEAYCWGSNSSGELGDGTTTTFRSTPVLVSGGLGLASVFAGSGHTCALTIGAEAYCWGSNFAGQLGDGTMTDRLTPVLVSGGLSFASLALGSTQTCGATGGGDAYCWGFNESGTLGDGTTTNRTTPARVSDP